jgi:hypothetical protein
VDLAVDDSSKGIAVGLEATDDAGHGSLARFREP